MPRYMYNMYPRPFYRPRVLWNAWENHTYNTSPGIYIYMYRSCILLHIYHISPGDGCELGCLHSQHSYLSWAFKGEGRQPFGRYSFSTQKKIDSLIFVAPARVSDYVKLFMITICHVAIKLRHIQSYSYIYIYVYIYIYTSLPCTSIPTIHHPDVALIVWCFSFCLPSMFSQWLRRSSWAGGPGTMWSTALTMNRVLQRGPGEADLALVVFGRHAMIHCMWMRRVLYCISRS